MTCNFQRVEITEPGTIGDVVTDAVDAGYDVTARLVRDWTARGLLDAPLRRPGGRGKGSRPALYTANQRMLFLTLLHHRRHTGLTVPSLARIPVSLWLYVGSDHVPGQQAHKAFMTWLGDPRSSRREAVRLARATVTQFDSPHASPRSRKTLIELLADIAYRGRLDDEASLVRATREVFEPGSGLIKRAIGHPSAPLSADAIVEIIRANLQGIREFSTGRVGLAEFEDAGQHQRVSMGEYVRDWPAMVSEPWAQTRALYDEPTLRWLIEESCSHLLALVGMRSLDRSGAPHRE